MAMTAVLKKRVKLREVADLYGNEIVRGLGALSPH